MKKRIVTIVSLIIALIMGLGIMGGCNLVTTNDERDLDQVVATVKLIEGDTFKAEEIKKKEMIMAYLNYGYYTYQGYSQEVVFTKIMENLVNARILVQNAMLSFESGVDPFDTVYRNGEIAPYNVARYLTKADVYDGTTLVKLSDVNEVEYNTIKSVNDFISSYVEAEEQGVSDTITLTTRTAPKNAQVDTKVSAKEKQDYIAKGIDKGDNDAKRRTAYLKFIDLLKTNQLLGDDFKGDIKQSVYYKNSVKTQQENKLIEKYENCIKGAERSKITYEMLKANYEEMYKAQQDKYSASASDFSSALSSATAENPIVYSPYSGYGYVYNLLLGASTEQAAQVAALKDTPEVKKVKRAQIYEGITVKDLRASWILAGYDFDIDTKCFTGDYTLTESANSLAFQGEVVKVKDKDEEKGTPAEYRVTEKEMGINEFISFMENYVYGGAQTGSAVANADIKKKCEISSAPSDYDERIQELLFAFSTDQGSLNTYKGYVVSPVPAPGVNETYVQEFADAGRELLTMGKNSYIMVATDYGYHVMFYSTVLEQNTGYATLEEYLDSLDSTRGGFASWEEYYNDMIKNWNEEDADTDFYLYTLQKLYSEKMETSILSEVESKVIEDNKTNSSKVVIYKDRYENLIKGE